MEQAQLLYNLFPLCLPQNVLANYPDIFDQQIFHPHANHCTTQDIEVSSEVIVNGSILLQSVHKVEPIKITSSITFVSFSKK